MLQSPDENSLVQALDQAVPVLRTELVFRPQRFGNKDCFVIEDPVGSRFFRIGMDEYTFISLLDGRRSIQEVLDRTTKACPRCTFTPADALGICQWVEYTGLGHKVSHDGRSAHSSAGQRQPPSSRRGRLSPLSVQVPLFHPDRFVARCQPWLSWLFSPPSVLVWLVVCIWALVVVFSNSDRLGAASREIVAPGNWFWLLSAWIVLKVIHECGHALACKRLGGEVREAGIVMILLAPLAYVDVSSCWRLRSKWARIGVSAAGMYVELFLAAVAGLIWSHTDPGLLNSVCLNVFLTASVMTLLFNANPLMRFDGYYILSDLLEMPNLYASGQIQVQHLTRRLVFGNSCTQSAEAGHRLWFVRVYGFASLIWRNLVFWGLVLSAATILEGAGIVLSCLALMFWISAWIRRGVALAKTQGTDRQPNWFRASIVAGGGSAAVASALFLAPWPGAIRAPAVVLYAPQVTVRTPCDGFVQHVFVRDGQTVQVGQVLATLVNEQLVQEVGELQLAMRQSRLQRRVYLRQRENGSAQAEAKTLESISRKLADKQRQMDKLTMRAPVKGKVIGRQLSNLTGTYFVEGSRLMTIGNESSKELRLAIAQNDIHPFRAHVGRSVTAILSDGTPVQSVLQRIEPQARTVPFDDSLCAPYGGPLTVRRVPNAREESESAPYEFLSPHFVGVVALPAQDSLRILSGRRGLVALHAHQSVGRYLYEHLQNWVDRHLHPGRA